MAKANQENRAPRYPSYALQGKVHQEGDDTTVIWHCILLDISETGAGLRMMAPPGTVMVGNRISFWLDKVNGELHGEVMRADVSEEGLEVGVALDPYSSLIQTELSKYLSRPKDKRVVVEGHAHRKKSSGFSWRKTAVQLKVALLMMVVGAIIALLMVDWTGETHIYDPGDPSGNGGTSQTGGSAGGASLPGLPAGVDVNDVKKLLKGK